MSSLQVPFNKPSLVGNEIKYMRDAVRRGQLAGDGTYTERCCNLLKAQLEAPSVLLTHSCTAALEMAAMLCDLGPGDEVIMPSFTFVSTANAVVLRGATPVFVDIDASTLCMDPDAAAAAITANTRAIFAVHYAGFPADIKRLAALAKTNDLFLIEDAAQALGSTYQGKQAGTFGDAATFSFHETKNVISGEGGALVINRPEWVERAEIIREKGTNRSQFFRGAVDKYTWVDAGSSYLPGELIAAFLLAQIETQDAIRKRRLSVFDTYFEAFEILAEERQITIPKTPPNCVGNGHMFYLLMDSLGTRTEFIKFMKQRGVITPFHYVPLHSSPAGQRFGRKSGDLSVTDRISATLVRLPMFFDLGGDVETVIEIATEALKNK
ncbi:dTDP-4-amino-4,6-dideoxygalactose transaminase [Marimonas sp. MJW-29]|uniref:dTDP-4-amino-4,6-dideoxygalactose transaminase n=1 Tax=Sulfitobacter sediminis TaxID=3234186 RepID=A0ABV3RPV5_9RHOB